MLKYEVTINYTLIMRKFSKLYSSIDNHIEKQYTHWIPLELKKNIKPKLMKITGSIKQKFKKEEIIF